jgi:hypothetical protein
MVNQINSRGGTEMKLLAAKEFNKSFYQNKTKHKIIVQAELVHRDGNSNAYFSITGETYYRAKNNRWVFNTGDCIHEEILQQFPQLKSLCDIHLSDENGVPMHAFENAGYWAGQTKYQTLDLVTLAKHLRVTQPIALDMLNYIEHYWGELDTTFTPAMAWKDACERFSLPFQWQQQADAAKAMLNLELEDEWWQAIK